MRILPVLDLLDGLVVRGVAGDRSRYRPVVSCLTSSSEPRAVARAFREAFGLDTLYVADLDAILRRGSHLEALRTLVDDGFQLLVDAGVASLPDACELRRTLECTPVIGLETLSAPDALAELVRELGGQELFFSIDLRGGRSLGDARTWPADVDAIESLAASLGVSRRILLDLEAVGVGAGVSHLERLRRWSAARPDAELVTGGGVRDRDDLLALRDAGVDGVLIASALHDGRITAADLASLSTTDP